MVAVSLLIPALNEERTLNRLLPSALRAVQVGSPINEIVLITSPSIDQTRQICSATAQQWSFVRHILLVSWLPKLHALARGASEATNEWLLLLDADVQVSAETLIALAGHAGSRPGIVQARNVPDALANMQSHRGGNVPTLVLWAVMTSLAWHWVRTQRPDLRWAVAGQCYLCHRSIIPSHSIAVILDDVTIGLNCVRLGFPIQYCPENVVVFKPARRWGDFLRQKLRNRIGLARFHGEVPDRVEALRAAFRKCLQEGSCLEGNLGSHYRTSAKGLLLVDTALWSTARVLAAFGVGATGKWRPAISTKM